MKFLEAVKILYPQVSIKSQEIGKKLCYNEEDIIAFFGADAIAKIPRYYDSYVNVVFGGCSKQHTVFLTDKAIEYLLNNYSCEKTLKIKEKMNQSTIDDKIPTEVTCSRLGIGAVTFTTGTTNSYVGARLHTLTSSIFKTLLENSFPDELFTQGLEFTSKNGTYKSSMYMPRYNISFEFPDAKNSPELRSLFIEKGNTKCIQLHDETTFGGDLAKTMLDYSVAIGVATKIITTFNK